MPPGKNVWKYSFVTPHTVKGYTEKIYKYFREMVEL